MEMEQQHQEIALKCSIPPTSVPSTYVTFWFIFYKKSENCCLTVQIFFSFFQRVLHEWSAAFFTIFKLGPNLLGSNYSKPAVDKWVSIDEYLDGYLVERSSRYGKKTEVLDLGMQEIRTYFRLFLLSSVLLLFMFCSRISKSKFSRPIVSAIPL